MMIKRGCGIRVFGRYVFALLFLLGFVMVFSGCSDFKRGRYNSSHFKMFYPDGWKEGEWMIPTTLPSSDLYDPEIFTGVSPRKHKATGTPDASITLFAQKMDQVMWMEDLYPMILREYKRADYFIMDKGEIMIGDLVFKWVLSKNVRRNEVAMDFYALDEGSYFFKIQYASHLDTFNKYRRDFEESKSTLYVKMTFF